MKKWIAKLLIVVLVLTMFAPSMAISFAVGETLTVDIPVLNVRDGIWGTWINEVYQGSKYDVKDSAKDNDGTTWYKITVDGQDGWVYGGHVTISGGSQATDGKKGVVNYESVYLRTSPWGTILDLIYKGTEVKVIGSQKDNDGETWYNVQVNEKTGYMYGKYIDLSSESSSGNETAPSNDDQSLSGSITVTWNFARVRTAPWGTVLGQLDKGDTAEVIGKTKDDHGDTWYKVKFQGREGYVHEENVRYSSAAPSKPSTPSVKDEALSGTLTVTWDFARVRVAPWGTILGQLKQGATAEVIGKTTDKDGATWYKIKYEGRDGYMHEDNVKFTAASSTPSNPSPSNPSIKDEALSGTLTVTWNFARVRVAPWGTILGQIERGGTAEVIGKTTDKDGDTWYKVKFEGKNGYMHQDNVKFTPASSNSNPSTPGVKDEALSGTLTVTWNFARVREVPWGTILGQINRGGTAEVIAKTTDKDGDTWYKVKFEGKNGYMHQDNVKFTPASSNPSTPGVKDEALSGTLTVTWNFARVREVPWGTILGQINRGGTAEVIAKTTDKDGETWYKVKFEGKNGYMHQDNVAFTPTASTPTDPKEEALNGKITVTWNYANVRSAPWGTILGQINRGNTADVVARTKDSAGEVWFKVKYNGSYGYVHEENVRYEDNSSSPQPNPGTGTTPGTGQNGTLRVNYSVLNVRKEPTTSSEVVTTIQDLTVHSFTDSKRDSRGDMWYRIAQGWVHGDYVDIGPQKVTGIDIVLSTLEFTGNPLEITALAQGTNRALYRISLKQSNGYMLLKDFSSERNALFTPSAEGKYTIKVEAKDIQASGTEKVVEASFTLKKNLSPHSYHYVNYGSLEDFARAQVGRAVKWKDGYWVDATYEEILNEMNPQTALTFDLPKLAPSPVTDIRITGEVNVRKGAGTDNPSMGYAYPGEEYKVYGTTEVKGEKWYQVNYKGETGWLHSSFAMDTAVGVKGEEKKLGDFVTIISNGTPMRANPNSSSSVTTYLAKNSSYLVLDRSGSWMKIQHNGTQGWILVSSAYGTDEVNDKMYQFLDLRGGTGISVEDLNRVLQGKGILTGQGAAFAEASRLHDINEIYLVSHALLETGNGNSELASGVVYNGVTVYNMYGIGAYDQDPVGLGAKTAYENGWTTPEKAIIDGAKWISTRYVHNSDGQNTLYKMRYNYVDPNHQYATDITWAVAQTMQIKNLYSMVQSYNLRFEIPVYAN